MLFRSLTPGRGPSSPPPGQHGLPYSTSSGALANDASRRSQSFNSTNQWYSQNAPPAYLDAPQHHNTAIADDDADDDADEAAARQYLAATGGGVAGGGRLMLSNPDEDDEDDDEPQRRAKN